jgi:putative phosphoesterase
MKIGVISDTHNYFDPQIRSHFRGVEHILHAGDVGMPSIILELEGIAPVTVVMGNNDTLHSSIWNETEVLELGGIKFLLHHIIYPGSLSEVAARAIQKHKPEVVVYGHTHQAHEERVEGITYFNPGYAGKPRFKQPRSLAVMETAGGKFKSSFKTL